ncbi:PH domain-containing protein [Brachybacterium huguangmaarense]
MVVRPRSAVIICGLTWALCAALLIEDVWRIGFAAVFDLPIVLAVAVAVWALLWRPCLIVREDSATVRNVLSTTELPFASILHVRIGAMVRIEHLDAAGRERVVTAWNAPGVGRDDVRERTGRARQDDLRGRGGAGQGRSTATWSERLVSDQQASPSAVLRRRWEQWQHVRPDVGAPTAAGRTRIALLPLALVAASLVLGVLRIAQL